MKIKSALVVSSALILGLVGPMAAFAATAPILGAASTYAIVSDTWTNSLNAGQETAVIGGVCYTTPPGTAPISINGATTTPLTQAVVPCTNGAAQDAALADLNSQTCTSLGTNVTLDSTIIPGHPAGTFPPGCYSSSGTMDITLSTTVTLDGPGVYIFRSGGALTTGQDSKVVLANGADASNVFWTPGSTATLGANTASSPTPTFVGTIIADSLGSTGIDLGHFANISGRLLAFGHTVTTDSNTITVPTTLHVIKLVVNGVDTAVASDFSISVKNASSGLDVAGSPASGTAAFGTSYLLSPGTYTISENSNPLYVQSFLVGGCDSNGNVTLATGDDTICTIINTDIPPPPPAPVSSGGGGGGGNRFVPLIGILKVPNPLALSAGPGSVTYNYTVWNVGGAQALVNVTVNDDQCGPVTLISGDANGNGKLDPQESWRYVCTASLSKTTTNTAVATGYSDDPSHQPAIATAVATVVVGVPVTPPLINIVKVPSRLTPLSFGGGPVTYTYIVTNPGVVPLHNVSVADDKCAPVSSPSGDANHNNLLDSNEAWTYTCEEYVSASTRNVATAQATANGMPAIAYAFATVLVSAPGLPNTGLPPRENGAPWDVVALTSAFVVLLLLRAYVIRKNELSH